MSDESAALSTSRRVLIVDDDEMVLDLLKMYVSLEGFQVATAKNGVEAAIKLKPHPPHLIISDLRMPKEGGFELLRTLKAEGLGSLPVIIVTASKLDQSTIAMVQQEGNVIDFIHKPLPRAHLIATIHRTLRTIPPRPSGDDARSSRGINDSPF